MKVDLQKLDYLVEMVGETMIASSMVQHDPDLRAQSSPRLQQRLAHLNRLILEIQQTAMAMRMVPIGGLLQKTARIARDLSKKSGKPIQGGGGGVASADPTRTISDAKDYQKDLTDNEDWIRVPCLNDITTARTTLPS